MNNTSHKLDHERLAPLVLLNKHRSRIGEKTLEALDNLIVERAASGLPRPDHPLLTFSDVQKLMPNAPQYLHYMAFFLSLWRRYKQVLDTDETMIKLIELTDIKEISAEPFRVLPYPCFYIRFPPGSWILNADNGSNNLNGCFVANDTYTDHDGIEHPAIRFLAVCDDRDRVFPYEYLYNAGSIRESVRQKRKCGFYYCNRFDEFGKPFHDSFVNAYNSDLSVLSNFLSLVLYIVSRDADIVQRQTAVVDPSPAKNNRIKDQYREISFWDVGVRVGAKWRKSMEKYVESDRSGSKNGGDRVPVRPHIRRGHYHHFWTGSRNEPSNRKLIVKWLPPTIVSSSDEELPTTIRPV